MITPDITPVIYSKILEGSSSYFFWLLSEFPPGILPIPLKIPPGISSGNPPGIASKILSEISLEVSSGNPPAMCQTISVKLPVEIFFKDYYKKIKMVLRNSSGHSTSDSVILPEISLVFLQKFLLHFSWNLF